MRIIGGKHRRRRFDVPKNFNARPTTDFAKENLFNVLQHIISLDGVRALDLFSGTGSIALELISRGCVSVVAVEQRREHAAFIRASAEALGEAAQVRVQQVDAFRYLTARGAVGEFDFVFADPPYKLKEIARLPELIFASGRLKPDALVVVEHPKEYDFSAHPHFLQHRAYGSVNFSFFSAALSGGEQTD